MSDLENKPETPQRLVQLRPRDTQAAKASSEKYSRTVYKLRWILPAFVLLGLALLMLWPMWQANRISAVMVENVPNLIIENLNLTGVDEKNQAYALSAYRALQSATARNVVELERPEGEISLDTGAWVAGRADKGRVDKETQKLWLGGNVELFHDDGYRFLSEEMNVDMGKSTAWGSQPVVIQGNFGRIEGVGFEISESGKVITIKGPATARLDLQRIRHSDKDNDNQSQAR